MAAGLARRLAQAADRRRDATGTAAGTAVHGVLDRRLAIRYGAESVFFSTAL